MRCTSRGPNGASGDEITAPRPRSTSCSSTNQLARPSHHGADEKEPSKPTPRSFSISGQLRPGVQARKQMSGKLFATAPMMRRQTSCGTSCGCEKQNPDAPAVAKRSRRSIHQWVAPLAECSAKRQYAAAGAGNVLRGSTG